MMAYLLLFLFTKSWIFLSNQAGGVNSCSGNFTSRSGVILSPNYPEVYDKNLNCTWEIRPDNGGRIVLNFHYFHLEYSYQCSTDYLMIYDGSSNKRNILLNKVCSTSMKNKTEISSSGWVLIEFKTDVNVRYNGFNISWDTCGGTFTDEEYHITAPQYHFNHKSAVCYFRMVTEKSSSVQIDLSETKLGTYTGGCLMQVLDSADVQLGEICNDTGPRMFIASTNRITVEFKLVYLSHTILNASFTNYKCSDTVNETSGVLLSPDYPSYFERDSICDYDFNFTIPANHSLAIDFISININCSSEDVLQFYQYDTNDSVIVIDVCTNNNTDMLYLKNRISMRFLSTYDDYQARYFMNYSVIYTPENDIIETTMASTLGNKVTDTPENDIIETTNANTLGNKVTDTPENDVIETTMANTMGNKVPGIITGAVAGVSVIAVLIAVALYRRKRDIPRVKTENITTNVMYANTQEDGSQFQREQPDPFNQNDNGEICTSNEINSGRQFNLRPPATASRETEENGADILYAETDENEYDVLHKARQKVVPDNLYDVSVKDDDQYDTTRQYLSPSFHSEGIYEKTNQIHDNDSMCMAKLECHDVYENI